MTDPEARAKAIELFIKVRDAAPPEIAKEWDSFVSFFEDMGNLNTADPKAAEALATAAAGLEAGMSKIEAYTKANCGLDMGG